MGAMTHLHFCARLLVRWAACQPAKMPPTSTVDNMEENTEFACQKKIHLCKNDLNIAVGKDNKRCHK